MMRHITPQIRELGGIVVEQEQFGKTTPNETDCPVVVAGTIAKDNYRGPFYSTAKRLFPERKVSEVPLTGMTADETEAFVAKLPSGKVDPKLVAYYSMGVPLLAQRFAKAKSAQEIEWRGRDYIRHAVRYNGANIRELATYLQMPVPAEFYPGSSDAPAHQIYTNLGYAERERASLAREGVVEESPLFVAPESERIYNAMLQNEHGLSEIEIYIPQMSAEDFTRLREAFGWDPSERVYSERGDQYGDYTQRKSNPQEPRCFGLISGSQAGGIDQQMAQSMR